MERVYGWPVAHETGYPDLCGGEETLAEVINYFNRDHRHTRAVLVNQWDWNGRFCGERMPADMTFADVRRGTDLEFGLSIYEPFGISQFEGLSFGAICAVSNVCGCMGFARKTMANATKWYKNIVEANFVNLPDDWLARTVEDLLAISIPQRDQIETAEGRRVAPLLVDSLPRTDAQLQELIDDGYDLARRMSWEHVVQDYFLPSLSRVSVAV